ncbi:MAG: HAD family phosphatase [Lachnospiraceae bacterium]|nr:HAD family phosphatase [Lachnospiraceae bacterium]
MAYKIIALDLDGTLVNSNKELTKATKTSLIEAQEKGIKLVLASGRPVKGIQPLADELKLAEYGGYILSLNGSFVLDCKTKEVMYANYFPDEMIKPICEYAREHNAAALSYDNELVITENPEDEYVKIEAQINNMDIKKVDDLISYIDYKINKILVVGEPWYMAELTKDMNEKFSDKVEVYRSAPFFIEVVPKGVDKAESLKRLLEKIDIKREELIACGDGYNDVSMVKYAGLGVAMANGCEDIKAVADYITASNDEDGIAKVVEKFV